ncbi:MAG: tetratricopeptide repeat protein, partial [Candidatus Obscuribacterales bacterium]|nr:tetratricopeptide repeat protein [Candidatus Obscuribacterales bacterium]
MLRFGFKKTGLLIEKLKPLRARLQALVKDPRYKNFQKLVWVSCILWAGCIVVKSIPYYIYIGEGKNAAIQGRYEQAEELFKLAVQESADDEMNDPRLAAALNNLGELYRKQARFEQAEPVYLRLLQIAEKLGAKKQEQALLLSNVSAYYRDKCDYARAEALSLRALAIWEKEVKKLKDPNYAALLAGHARVCKEEGAYKKAELYYDKALSVRVSALGKAHPDSAALMSSKASLLRKEAR